MDSRSFALETNPRVVAFLSSALTEEVMALAGVSTEGIRIMSGLSEFLVLKLDNVPVALARRVKELMISLGSDAALEESAWSGGALATPLVLMATRRQIKELFRALAQGDEGQRVMGDVLACALNNYGRRSFSLKLPGGRLELGSAVPAIMGILNVTPDSFSDGGDFLETDAAVHAGVAMAAEGADIIDIGGESTKPGSKSVDLETELSRVIPVIKALSRETPCPISIDTSKAAVAARALEAGAAIVNDVTALTGDPEMAGLAAKAGCPVVLMHMKGTPLTMQKSPFYYELMAEIGRFLREAVERAVLAGINPEQIILDPGIGFGKTVDHNLRILRRLKELSSLGRPILVGPSRKSFIGKMLDIPVRERAFGTAAAVALATAEGAAILRVHDVAQMRQAAVVAAGVASGASGEGQEG